MADLQLAPEFHEAMRARLETPEGQAAMQELVALIAQAAFDNLPPELVASLDTPEGKRAFEEAWPSIVDAYFCGLRQPASKQ